MNAPQPADSSKQLHECAMVKTGDTRTLADSAYQSMSPDDASIATASASTEGNNQPGRIRPIPGSELLMFQKAVDKVIAEEYRNIQRALEKRLKDVLRSARQNMSNLSIHLVPVGRTYSEAEPKLLVLCAPEAEPSVRAFFQLAYVKTILTFGESSSAPLEHIIVPQPPKFASAQENIRVFAQRTCTTDGNTYCGTPIIFALDDRKRKRSIPQLATFGGIVKVTFGNAESKLFGTSAGHAVERLRSEHTSDGADGKSTDQTGEESFNLLDWIPAECAIGDILHPEAFHGVSAGRVTLSYDWVLFNIDAARPNEVIQNGCGGETETSIDRDVHPILKAEKPQFQDEVSDPVLLLGASGGSRRGELSSVPTRIWLAGSEGFVDAYLLQLENGTVREGDSGAWVVHAAAPELYGHVVATNLFGDAYLMPALQTFENMRDGLGAISVTLPSPSDLVELGSTKASEASCSHENPQLTESCGLSHPGASLSGRALAPDDSNCSIPGTKVWNPRFSKQQPAYEANYLDYLKVPYDATGNSWAGKTAIEAFLDSFAGSVPSFELERVKQFCNQSTHESDAHLVPSAKMTRRAWVHHAGLFTGENWGVQPPPGWLTARQLQCSLESNNPFGTSTPPDRDRRLIYISDLDPEYILALVNCVPYDHSDALRDAISKHITRQTSFKVTSSYLGFRLELHLPYLRLRKSSIAATCGNSRGLNQRCWTDLPFLEHPSDTPCAPGRSSYEIHEAQDSVVICGTSDFKWVGHAFSSFGDCQHDDGDDSYGIVQDMFQSAGSDYSLDANLPIWDPRTYFLDCVKTRVDMVLKEWTYLIQNIEAGMRSWLADQNYGDRDSKAPETLNQLQGLSLEMRHFLPAANRAWNAFSAADGDKLFFSDLKYIRALHELRESFTALYLLEAKLDLLEDLCEKSTKMLTLADTMAAERTSFYTRVNVQLISIIMPLVITLQCFDTESNIFPFERNSRTFILFFCVLFFLLPLLTFMVERLHRLKASVIKKLISKRGRIDVNDSSTTESELKGWSMYSRKGLV